MSKLTFVFPLLVIALIGIAIYVQITSSTLSLPISTATAVLTILLPLFTAANVIYTPILNRRTGLPSLLQLLLPALHIIQGVLAVIIATLAAQGFTPGRTLECGLEGNWQQLWHTHNFRTIERIQNAFECCGFHSVIDRVWPQQCSDIYDRTTSCDGPWGAAMQRTSGLQFTVAVLAGIIQLAQLAYLRQRSSRGTTPQDVRRIGHRAEEGAGERLIQEPYHDSEDEHDVGINQHAPQSDASTAQDHPRVQPSNLGHDEANEWRS
ncbi:hypothetical protein F4808DRAFT_240522 [Astrocystis sublimbata]|nr:hypothetical protein F4808DRAFT_240522 [Astrocystis sublimbata]